MNLEEQNAVYIQQINKNLQTLDKNVAILENNISLVNEAVRNLARDACAMQRAIIEFMKEKDLIKDEDDVKLLQKLHLRHIAALDQEIEEKKRRTSEK
jgi:hypothetical protein